MTQRSDLNNKKRPALTLIEMLVSTVVTLLLVYGLAAAFASVSEIVSANRATLELASQMRGATLQLQQDLEGVTVPMKPWANGAAGQGYFEYREGAESDYWTYVPVGATAPPSLPFPRVDTHVGDYDDILMFTTRNTEQPFRGQINPGYLAVSATQSIEPVSTVAEVAWWTQLVDTDGNGVWSPGELFRLHRRVLLVLPEVNSLGTLPNVASVPLAQFLANNDLSVRVDDGGQIVANSLSDLSTRANRFGHIPVVLGVYPGGSPLAGEPYPLGGYPSILNLNNGFLAPGYALTGARQGEDLILPNCIGFDVQAYDPMASVREDANSIDALAIGDPGFVGAGTSAVGTGAYVDLNYAGTNGLSLFSGPPLLRSGLSGGSGVSKLPSARPYVQPPNQIVYDTWSLGYERDGINQDSAPPPTAAAVIFPEEWDDPFIDEGLDGEDNLEWTNLPPVPGAPVLGAQHGTDDVGERETSPPYPVPLRGIKIRFRLYELNSRQVRQATVVSNFTPE